MLSTLPGLLVSIQLWVMQFGGQESLRRWNEAQEKIAHLMSALVNLTNSTQAGLTTSFRDFVSKLLEHRIGDWESAAAAMSREWAKWHWSSYAVWCLHNGTHTTPARGFRRWNNEMIWKKGTEFIEQWHLFEDDLTAEVARVREEVKSELEELASSFEGKQFGCGKNFTAI